MRSANRYPGTDQSRRPPGGRSQWARQGALAPSRAHRTSRFGQPGRDTVCCAPRKVLDQWFAWQHTARQVISSFVPQPVTNTFDTVCDGMMKNYQEGCTTLCGALELPRNDKRRD